uniref:NADH dehydrogenase subunit 4 n=1 Tax=Leptocimbex linealis TaxID=2609717 RepID=UPI0022377CE9|nr:NADH dehydrogenase subunit 4 [Leptocimbex linealis]UYK52113.1 NADH dehydrogenase subunit 4 [Leptocimbex linealis]
MMKIMLYMMFMVPLSFKLNFWLFQNFFFVLSLIFMYFSLFKFSMFQLGSFLGCDILSFGLILLTFWIGSLMFMASSMVYELKLFKSYFILLILLMLLLLFLSFSVTDLLMFYLFFESSIIPILFLIFGWGFQLDRIQAGFYLLFYTLFASLPLLISIIYVYSMKFSLCLFIFFEGLIYLSMNYVYLFMILSFLVKMPMFLVHLWLPKAHVEAPISGSMILAAVMLKLGGYGLLRIFNILINLCNKFNYIWISVSMIGGIIISLICLYQIDLKSLIAYSSVAHMSMLLGGLMTLLIWGVSGSYLLMISHGLCSSGLFCLVNIIYERSGSRSLLINKGLINFMPSMTLWWFLLCSSNMAAPPSLNLLGEIMLINSLNSWSVMVLFLLMFLTFFSASYSLYLYSFTQHGNFNINIYSFSQGYLREFILLMLHWIPLNLLILNSEVLILLL